MTLTKTIYGERIRQARELSGLTQKELALKAGCNQSAIAQFEGNRTSPSTEVLAAIANTTGFLPNFFQVAPTIDFPLGTLAFRSVRTLPKKERERAYQYALTMYEQYRKLAINLSLPLMRIPRINEKPELAAKVTRAALGLSPDSPIPNLTNAFESNGGIIFVSPFMYQKIDAYSHWARVDISGEQDRPIIIVSAGIPGDRLRFSIAHELGHIVMHNSLKGSPKKWEKEAHEFASAFLMPSDAIKRELATPVTLTTVAQLKPRWRVSMQAIIYRAYTLDIINERQFRYLFEQLSSKGWRKKEPSNLDIPIETPNALRDMITTLYPDAESYAKDNNLQIDKARQFILYA